MKEGIKFLLTPMEVLDPGSADARPSAWPPIDMSGNLSAYMSAKSPSNNSEPKDNISKYPPFMPKNRIVRGERGSRPFLQK